MKIGKKITSATITLIFVSKISASQVTFQSDGKLTTTKTDSVKPLQTRPRKAYLYILPDGKVIPEKKVDSVAKSWGGLIMNRDVTKNPVTVHLLPPTASNKIQNQQKQETQEESLRKKLIGKPAPDFSLKDLNGKTWKISDLKGKTVVLNFWFTTCAPCIKEIPVLNQVVNSWKGKGVVFLAPALDKPMVIGPFQKQHKFSYTILSDAASATAVYGVYAWPTHIIIDKNGIVRQVLVGNNSIGEEINGYLKENH